MAENKNHLSEQNVTRTKIFMAAARLFAEKGYNGVSMREISESSGVSKPTIYYYFGNKEGIYKALVDTGLHYNWQILQDIIQKNLPIKQKMVELLKIRFQQVLEYPEFAKFFLNLYLSTENLPFLREIVQEAESRREIIVRLIQEGIARGEFGPRANPNLATEIFMGTALYFILKQLNTGQQILSDDLAEKIVDFLFRGLNE
ncbi:MAG: TetR/AcrR family transcriptional regulator [Calditrichia bacterium]